MESHHAGPERHSHRRHRRFTIEQVLGGALVALLVGGGLVFALGEGLIHWRRTPSGEEPAQAEAPAIPEDPAAAARKSVEAFFEAADLPAKAATVRDSRQVLPLMEDYYRTRLHPLPTLGRLSKPQVVTHPDGSPMVLFEIESYDEHRTPVAVVWDGARFAVDWESMVAYGTMDWRAFLDHQPSTRQTLRVYVEAAHENERIPGLPAETEQFRVWHRDDPEPVVAMAASRIELAKLVGDKHGVPLTLEMEWDPAGAGKVPAILRLVTPRWAR